MEEDAAVSERMEGMKEVIKDGCATIENLVHW